LVAEFKTDIVIIPFFRFDRSASQIGDAPAGGQNQVLMVDMQALTLRIATPDAQGVNRFRDFQFKSSFTSRFCINGRTWSILY
jgi:hypothetical protein